jgi:hypothetical protein
MALFRHHRELLSDSLETTVVIKSKGELDNYLQTETQITAYPNKESCFDSRIGWYTHIVCNSKGIPKGFLSEALE